VGRAAAVEATLQRDRLWVLSALAAITLLAWIHLVDMAAGMEAAAVAQLRPWTAGYAVMMFLMWAIMMVGMMLPSAAPVMLLHARVCRRRVGRIAPTGSFLLGYVTVWTGCSAGATALQWGLERLALLSPSMTTASPALGAVVLIAAGLYQLTPAKKACLAHCRSPMDFLASRWRDGGSGAFRMGMEHGAYCAGCCWSLMLVLFVVGVMDLLWVAAIAFLVLLEKVAPAGRQIARAGAVALISAGLALPVVG
jgi:predicted metal-binding membrane protein